MRLNLTGACLLMCSLVIFQPLGGFAQQNSDAAKAQQISAGRDGQHDFDPLIGSWRFHLKKLLHPLTGSTTWAEFEGTGACYRIWDGRSQMDTIEMDSPDAGHIEGLTLRLYNPQSHQWRLYWANSKVGVLDAALHGVDHAPMQSSMAKADLAVWAQAKK